MNTDKNDPESQPDFDLNHPKWYLNRELAWLAFNQRVLNEAKDSRTPPAGTRIFRRRARFEPRRVFYEAHRRTQTTGWRRGEKAQYRRHAAQ